MEAKEALGRSEKAKMVYQLYLDTGYWKSKLRFMQDEIAFIDRLLNSYVFEPNTLNLFERIQDYQERLKKAKSRKIKVTAQISKHENSLGGILECKDKTCDLSFCQKHDRLKAEVVDCVNNFQDLKGDIFNYAGGILKKRKPDK